MKQSSLSQWRFWLPLCLQIVLILTVPTRAAYTLISGKTAVLQTVPVDPYDLLRGYSQTLRYDISRPTALSSLPGWDKLPKAENRGRRAESLILGSFYVIMAKSNAVTATEQSQQPWQPIAVSREVPVNLPENQVAIQGKMSGYTWIDYGLEAYYFPEVQRREITAAIRQANNRSGENPPLQVEVKVDKQGKAVPIRLWVGEKEYKF